jgi:endonuclease G
MKKYLNLIGMTVLAMAMLSCKDGRSGGQATQAEFVSANVAGAAEAQLQATVGQAQRAKTIVMYEMPAPLKDRPEQILRRRGYTTSYNSKTKNPNWVAWHLTKDHTYGSQQRSREVFTEDESVKAPRATDND